LIQNYFDRQVQLDRKQRRAAYRRANEFFKANKRHVRTYLAATMTPFVILFSIWLCNELFAARPSRLIRFLYCPVLLICVYLGHSLACRSVYAPHVRRAVREFGYDLCLECGYWLHGLTDDIKRCPECGTPRPSGDATPEDNASGQ
jgi:hypothetical protein